MLPSDVSAVVCTMNSIASIEACLLSLREAGVGEVIVVDANSSDGTQEVARRLASAVVIDAGTGLGQARNQGIRETKGALVLNMGSDNTITQDSLRSMIQVLETSDVSGVSARTLVPGRDYLSRSLNTWRQTRFRPGAAPVIGTPTLFRGNDLRADPYDISRAHSDDAELCERWTRKHGARFAIADAVVHELGKATWGELRLRCRNYGISDHEIYTAGVASGWSMRRMLKSLTHPLRVDLLEPLTRAGAGEGLRTLPFLVAVTSMRYFYWIRAVRIDSGKV